MMGRWTRGAITATVGLTSQEVAQRHADGRGNELTRFNAILLGLFVIILIVGPVQDGLFGLVLVANSGIGILQELRAKRTLDRLSVLNAPSARAVRDGEVAVIPAGQVVLDDVLELRQGDQLVVDGRV